MKKNPLIVSAIAVAVVIFLVINSALFTINETQQAVVLRLGKPQSIYVEPGLKFKLPVVDEVRYFDKRVLNLDPAAEEFILADQELLSVDYYVRYRIVDALAYLKTLKDERSAGERMRSIVNTQLRGALGKQVLATILSEERANFMKEVQKRASAEVQDFGVEIVDIRIGKTDLPSQIRNSVFDRMRSERQREAAEARAQGAEAAQKIRSEADRERTVILAEAQKTAAVLRGEGDAERARILNVAYSQNPEFFEFIKTMDAYRSALSSKDNYMMLSLKNAFLQQLNTQ